MKNSNNRTIKPLLILLFILLGSNAFAHDGSQIVYILAPFALLFLAPLVIHIIVAIKYRKEDLPERRFVQFNSAFATVVTVSYLILINYLEGYYRELKLLDYLISPAGVLFYNIAALVLSIVQHPFKQRVKIYLLAVPFMVLAVEINLKYNAIQVTQDKYNLMIELKKSCDQKSEESCVKLAEIISWDQYGDEEKARKEICDDHPFLHENCMLWSTAMYEKYCNKATNTAVTRKTCKAMEPRYTGTYWKQEILENKSQ